VKRILRARIFARSGVSSYTSTKEITASHPVTCANEYQKEKIMDKADPTINELRKIFIENGLEFFIKKEKNGIVKVHFIVRKEDNVDTLGH